MESLKIEIVFTWDIVSLQIKEYRSVCTLLCIMFLGDSKLVFLFIARKGLFRVLKTHPPSLCPKYY